MADDSQARAENPVSTNGHPERMPGKKKRTSSQKSGSYLPDIHRTLPQSLEAEKGVLGSILLSPAEVLGECVQRIESSYFYNPAHASIYEVLIELYNASKPIDLITLTQELRDRALLDQVGGAAAISDLFTFVPTAANAGYYLDILKDKFLLRRIISTCTEFAGRSYEEQGDVRNLLDEAERNILSIGEDRYKKSIPELKEILMQAIEMVEKLVQNKGGINGLPTGFAKLDEMTNGLHAGDMFVIAARPSVGKTALAMNIVEHVAVDQERPVAVFSLEMSSQQLVQRLLCSRAKVDMQKLRTGFLGNHETTNIASAANELSRANVFIDDTPGLSILELRAKARRLKSQRDIALIVIDYLQLLRSPSRRAQENRQIEISEISAGIKGLAKELGVPVIVLAQLNRDAEKREGGKPRLSDLRESGSIEQDADVVGALWRKDYQASDDEPHENAGEAELSILKQRNGPTGDVPLTFLRQFTRFEMRAFERDENR